MLRMQAMRVLMISKACVVGAYQRKLEELARLPGMELVVLVPPSWRDSRGEQPLERAFTRGYELRTTPIAFNGRFHLHFYPRLAAEYKALRPDLVHIDEEPYNLATRQAIGLAQRWRIPACFFSWQNLYRRYPPPFGLWERYVLRHAAYAIAGNHAAAQVLRAKGYRGPLVVIPQFGIDPDLFAPATAPSAQPFTIGYAGGLVPEKGVDTLLRACRALPGSWRLLVAGEGAQRPALEALADRLGIADRIEWRGRLGSLHMPRFYQELDVLVLPSRTRRHWQEQFGRVLVEAMACGVAVIGSDSGEIPHVIGDAGLIFPEGDEAALAAHLDRLRREPDRRAELGRRGRARVLDHFTQARIARATYAVYRQMLGLEQPADRPEAMAPLPTVEV
jgi:glycosyltransferase involved in cell wall biosynthesis